MEVRLRGRRVSLSADDALGDGGEATVVRHEDVALKIYHRPSAVRAAKLESMIQLAGGLPPAVVAPRELVHDARGKRVVGFVMRALGPEHELVAALSRRAARATSGIGTRDVAALFLDAHQSLAAIHRAGAVVGDLNDMNETFAPIGKGALGMAWIDVDSFQIPGFPCEVATEAFLDPELYGPDLAQPVVAAGGPRWFRPENDWYAYAVLLFRSLTLVHPFGGTDPALKTLPRRAAARKSVLAPGVRYPARVGFALEVLSDDLVDVFRGVFERGRRATFPRPALETYLAGLTRCRACGAEHPAERPRCPMCAALAPAPIATSTSGCSATDLLETRGEILLLAASPSTLRCVAVEEGSLVLHSLAGRRVQRTAIGAVRPGLRIELGARILAISEPGSPAPLTVHALSDDGIGPAFRTTTERFGAGRASFACSASSLYRIAGGVLLRGMFRDGVFEERPVTTVMREQTTVFADRSATAGELAIGCSRSFGERRLFLVARGRRLDLGVAELEPGEALLAESAVFSDKTAAYLQRTRLGGQDRVRTVVFADDGALVARYASPVSSRVAAGVIDGAVSSGKSLLFPTDRGIARERLGAPTDPTPASQNLFAASEPFVGKSALLCALPDGLAVAHGARVRLLCLD